MTSLYEAFQQSAGIAPVRSRYSRSGSYGGSTATRTPQAYLPEEVKSSMLSDLARQAGGAVEVLGKALDTPGAIFRGVLAGKPTSGFSWDSDTRVTGEELLKEYGLLDDKSNSYLSTAAGLGAEIVLDPLFLVQGPMRALGAGGKAAKAAGLLDDASRVATNRIGTSEAIKRYRTGRNAKAFFDEAMPYAEKALNEKNLKYRPLVGPRVARTTTTLRELVDNAADPAKALENVTNYLNQRGLRYADEADKTLGNAIGFGPGTSMFGFNPAGAEGLLDAIDAATQSARWSRPAREFSRVFDKRVESAGTANAADQLAALRSYDEKMLAAGEQYAKNADYLLKASSIKLPPQVKTALGVESLTDAGASDFMTRLAEGTYTRSDDALRRLIGPQIDDLTSTFRNMQNASLATDIALGRKTNKFQDMYGVLYSPSIAKEADFGEYGKGLSRSSYLTSTLEQEGRKKEYLTPGGRVDLREISLLPIVRQFVEEGEKSSLSISDVGREIKRYIDTKHGPNAADPRVRPFKTFVKDAAGNPLPDEVIGQGRAEKIASFMQRISKDTPDDVALFGEHPLTTQVRSLVNQSIAQSNARFVYDSIAESATRAVDSLGNDIQTSALAGTRRSSLDVAANRIAQGVGLKTEKTGNISNTVANNLKQRIAALHGLSADDIDLSKWSLPDDVVDRLTRVNDFYNKPRAQQDLLDFFNRYSTLLKGFLLAWPSRHTRDLYSNAYTVWLETGSGSDSLYGFSVARHVLKGNYDSASQLLKQIPEYAKLSPDQIKEKFVRDTAQAGVLRTLASSDLMTSNRSAEINQLVPGSTPTGFRESLKELVPDGSRSAGQMASDFFTFRGVKNWGQKKVAQETLNPVLNASQKINDYSDSLARLAGYVALLRQGNTPQVAAQRITSALIDYGSLTVYEKQLRNIFPWWAYNSRIGAYVVKSLINNPGGGYAQTLRAMNTLQATNDDTYIPEAMRQSFAFRVPDFAKPYLAISDEENTTAFFRDIDIPGVDLLSLVDPQSTAYGTVLGTAGNVAQQMHPLYRTAIETMTGQDLFSRRPLSQASSGLDKAYRALFGSPNNMDPLVRAAINLVPGTSRLASLAGGALDERLPDWRRRAVKQAFNTFTGVKIQDVDPEWQLQDAMRKIRQPLDRYMQDYSLSYIPQEKLPSVPPELMPYYYLKQELDRDLREARNQRKAAQ